MNGASRANWRWTGVLVLLAFALQACSCSHNSVSPPPSVDPPRNCNWIWQNPLPTGNHYTAVSFVDSDTGTAVGVEGTILRTTTCN
jgi:hypothetical protein